jgi:hypothetical protein
VEKLQDTSESTAPSVDTLAGSLAYNEQRTRIMWFYFLCLNIPSHLLFRQRTRLLHPSLTCDRCGEENHIPSSTCPPQCSLSSMNSSSQPPRSGVQMDTRSPLLSPSMSPDSPASISLPLPKVQEASHISPIPSSQILPIVSPSIMKASSSTAVGP